MTLLSVPGKFLTDILLRHIRDQSNLDSHLVLRVIIECLCEFGPGLLTGYVNLKKAFELFHCELLWENLRFGGIQTRIIGLNLYTFTESAVKYSGGLSCFIPINSEVRQGLF